MDLIWSHFFDDFLVFTPPALAANTESTVCTLFSILGWKFAQDGNKSKDFSQSFGALGIQIDLFFLSRGYAAFGNTERRARDLKEIIASMLKKKSLTILESQKLRGRMQFADGQLMGRIGRLGLKAIPDHAFLHGAGRLNDDCVLALERFANHLESAEPRRVSAASGSTWYMYTDACFDKTDDLKCGIGGVLVDHLGAVVAVFSLFLDRRSITALGGDKKETVIFEAELLALIISFYVFREWIDSNQVVIFIDNNAARDASISGRARNPVGMLLIETLLILEVESRIFPWYARVPSPSNIADDPSRGQYEHLLKPGAKQVDVEKQVDAVLNRLK